MSRSTQFIGLSPSALKFVNEKCHKEPVVTCDCCGHSKGGNFITKIDRHTSGMFEEEIPLTTFYMYAPSPVGEKVFEVKEVVQCDPWSSGPMIFTHLQLENGEFIGSWTDEEINKMITG